jgi:hypothetical protein
MFASFLCLCLLGFAVAFPSEPPFQRPEGWGKPICPEDIDQVGRHYSNWTVTHDISSLFACYEPKLVLFPIGIPIDSPESNIYIRNAVSKLSATPDLEAPASPPKDSWMNHTAVVSVGQGASQGGELDLSGQVVTAARHLSRYLLANDPGEGKAFTLFLHFGKSVVGVYLGGRVHTPLTAVSILDSFASYVSAKSPQGSVVFQHCGAEVAGGLVFGVVSSISGGADGLVAVQKAVQAWARGECHGEVSETETFNLPIWAYEPFRLQGSRFGNMTANSTVNATFNSPIKRTNNPPGPVPVHSDKRAAAACSEIRVESDNGCEQLADRCGISIGSLYQYNNGLKGTCTRLKIGQRICCTSGGLKSNRKSPGTDGVCASHLVKPTENCDGIASMYDVEAEDLVRFNKGKTWQWAGCGAQLRFDTIICVSEGEPPMPPRSSGAKCGPQADKDTPRPPKGTSLASLNPCPLNA